MPATIPYNQTHDSHTGGSYTSSDRGSSSTSGKRVGALRQKQILGRSLRGYKINISKGLFFLLRLFVVSFLLLWCSFQFSRQSIIVMNHIITYNPKPNFEIPPLLISNKIPLGG